MKSKFFYRNGFPKATGLLLIVAFIILSSFLSVYFMEGFSSSPAKTNPQAVTTSGPSYPSQGVSARN